MGSVWVVDSVSTAVVWIFCCSLMCAHAPCRWKCDAASCVHMHPVSSQSEQSMDSPALSKPSITPSYVHGAPLKQAVNVVCPAPVSVFLFVPTEVPQAAAHLEVRVLHCLRPGGISSTASCSTHSTTSKTHHQQLQLVQQWLACVRLFSLCWQGGPSAAAGFAWQHCSAAVCSACNNLEQGRT
jgi:hypothetical protein